MFQEVQLIAEIAQAHDGSLGILHSMIDAIADAGVKIAKFQMHIAQAESSSEEPFRVKFSYVDKTRFDYWKRMEFTKEEWQGIKKHCEDRNLEFLCSPFSCMAVDLLESLNVKRYKIASGEISNYLMLDKIAKTGKEVILSSGMSSIEELDKTIQFLKPYKNVVSILQCTTQYPTSFNNIGLNLLEEYRNKWNIDIGLSDHSGSIYPSIAAVALGAKIIEVHVTFDKNMFGPDSKSSINFDELKKLAEGINIVSTIINNPLKKEETTTTKELKKIFNKSLAINRDAKQGEILTINDFESKKPSGCGISVDNVFEYVSRPLRNNKTKWDFITNDDFE